MSIFKTIILWFSLRLGSFFKGIDFNKLFNVAIMAVVVGNKVKTFIEGPQIAFIEMLSEGVPGLVGKEKAVISILDKWLTKLLPANGYSGAIPADISGKITILNNVILPAKSESEKTTFWHNFVAVIGADLADGQFSLKDFFGVVELAFRKVTGKA